MFFLSISLSIGVLNLNFTEKIMNPILRNVLAVIAGLIGGSIANMGLVMIGYALVPLPPGLDPANMETFKASAHLLEGKHFIFPFVAHAAGALIGALVASLIGGSKRLMLALIVGCFFLLGGIAASFMIPAPAWFVVLDLVVAYIPMAWLGWKLSGRG